MEPEAREAQIEVQWPAGASLDPKPVNQFVLVDGAGTAQGRPEGSVYLLFGHVSPPLIVTESDYNKLFEGGTTLSVSPQGSFFMTRERAIEFWHLLGDRLRATGPLE